MTVNANSLGVAVVYLIAPLVVRYPHDIQIWNLGIAVASTAASLLAYCFLESSPRCRARKNSPEKTGEEHLQDNYDWRRWSNAFTHPGFTHTVIAFAVAETIFNVVSAMIGKFLAEEGFTKAQVGVIGSMFIVSCLVGSQVISHHVDSQQNHKRAIKVCLVLTSVFLYLFKLALIAKNVWTTLLTLMLAGWFQGPLLPLALELGVECAFPTSEATVAALQQLTGNAMSAAVLPLLAELDRATSSHALPAYMCTKWVMAVASLLTCIMMFFLYVLFGCEVNGR
ncbi:TPA: hypothetical protein N0F65_003426 [Lagenidium giganteum]|uniref:Uncharacterized protein n=1 Tax=Lagenidium giganteum TaxID=4803 RepID=A0AAV2YHK4_9STRA|nr:TPA: hypothetical protein N0F65_003426 [Lagenidium giganteum]